MKKIVLNLAFEMKIIDIERNGWNSKFSKEKHVVMKTTYLKYYEIWNLDPLSLVLLDNHGSMFPNLV